MTVATTNNRISYTGNGVTTAFSMPYYFLANTDLAVYKGTALQTLTTHYSVTGAGNPSGGTVTFMTAPSSTDTVVIIRDPALTQLVDYIANDTFPAETHERALDLLTMISQRLADRVGRSIILPDSIVGVDASLPTPAAGAFIGWDANGTALASYAGVANVTISSAMQPVVQANSTASARSLLGAAGETVTTQAIGDMSGNIASTGFVSNASSPALFTLNAEASAAGNLTINTSTPVRVDFRNTNTTLGTPLTAITGSNLTLTVPLGATLGASANTNASAVPVFLYNNGNVTLGVVNPTGFHMDQNQLLNTTVLNGTSNSSGVVYSASALTLTPFRLATSMEYNQSVAGNWSGALRRVNHVGGAFPPGAVRCSIRLQTANGYGSTNTMIRRFATVTENTGGDYMTYTDSATLGGYITILRSGNYAMNFNDSYGSAEHVGISKNSTQLTTQFFSINLADKVAAMTTASANLASNCGTTIYLAAGDVIRAHTTGAAFAGASAAMFTITRAA